MDGSVMGEGALVTAIVSPCSMASNERREDCVAGTRSVPGGVSAAAVDSAFLFDFEKFSKSCIAGAGSVAGGNSVATEMSGSNPSSGASFENCALDIMSDFLVCAEVVGGELIGLNWSLLDDFVYCLRQESLWLLSEFQANFITRLIPLPITRQGSSTCPLRVNPVAK